MLLLRLKLTNGVQWQVQNQSSTVMKREIFGTKLAKISKSMTGKVSKTWQQARDRACYLLVWSILGRNDISHGLCILSWFLDEKDIQRGAPKQFKAIN